MVLQAPRTIKRISYTLLCTLFDSTLAYAGRKATFKQDLQKE